MARTSNNKPYRSKFEAFIGGWFKHLLKRRRKKSRPAVEYEADTLKYVVPEVHRTYTPDFIITFPSGRKIYVECKGYFRATDRQKMVLVKQSHPEKDIRLVFSRNNKIHKNSTMTYTDWADKHGFPWAVGAIPKEWTYEHD